MRFYLLVKSDLVTDVVAIADTIGRPFSRRETLADRREYCLFEVNDLDDAVRCKHKLTETMPTLGVLGVLREGTAPSGPRC